MAIEGYIVAFDIKEATSGNRLFEAKGTGTHAGPGVQEKLGAKEEVTLGQMEVESEGLGSQGIKGVVADCKLIELLAGSAEEAVEAVRLKFGEYSGKSRAVVKPATNFKPLDK